MFCLQAIETESMDSEDFAFLMRGAFASVISRNFDSNIGVSAKTELREPRVIIPLLDILCVNMQMRVIDRPKGTAGFASWRRRGMDG